MHLPRPQGRKTAPPRRLPPGAVTGVGTSQVSEGMDLHECSMQCMYMYACMYYVHTVALYCGNHWDPRNCPDFRDVLNSGVAIATTETKESVHIWDIEGLHCIHMCTCVVCNFQISFSISHWTIFKYICVIAMCLCVHSLLGACLLEEWITD